MLKRLHNDDWGIETNCFVCEPTNAAGLQIPFFHDTDRDVVSAEFELSRSFSGAPAMVHGGVTLALLDEAMAWACIAVGHQWAVTTQTATRFDRAVYVDRPYRVEAEVTGRDETTMTCRAVVLDRHAQIRAEARATFTTLGEAQATRLGGTSLSDDHRTYLDG